MAPDGTTLIRYTSPSAQVGDVTIEGNAKTQQMGVTASKAPGCNYTLVPATGGARSAYSGNVGDWALGRWEGTISQVAGNAYGSMGLTSGPRTLIIQRDSSGQVSCFWFIPADGQQPTKQCTVKANGISLITIASSVVELYPTGSDTLQGTFRPDQARGVVALGNS